MPRDITLERTTGFEPATLTLARCWEIRSQALSTADDARDAAATAQAGVCQRELIGKLDWQAGGSDGVFPVRALQSLQQTHSDSASSDEYAAPGTFVRWHAPAGFEPVSPP